MCTHWRFGTSLWDNSDQMWANLPTGLSVTGNTIQNSMSGTPGLKTQNNLGPSIGLSIEDNTFTDNAGVAIWLYCNDNECTSGTTVSGNTFSGNAITGNQCNGMVQDDDLNNIITCWCCFDAKVLLVTVVTTVCLECSNGLCSFQATLTTAIPNWFQIQTLISDAEMQFAGWQEPYSFTTVTALLPSMLCVHIYVSA